LLYNVSNQDSFFYFVFMKKSNRRKFLGTAAVIAVGTAASAMPLSDKNKLQPVVHHVFFWLKNPDSKADRDQLIKGIKTLSKIETIQNIHIGTVASTEKREVVDNSWSVSELLFFKDLEGQAIYQTHPIHLEFIKNCSHLWSKVLVYDIIEA
jgi:hypothetical protein